MVFGGTSCSHISHSLVAATAVDLQLLFLGGRDCQQALETLLLLPMLVSHMGWRSPGKQSPNDSSALHPGLLFCTNLSHASPCSTCLVTKS